MGISAIHFLKVIHGSELMIFDSIKINKDCSQKISCCSNLEKSGIWLYNQDGTKYAKKNNR